MTDRRLPSLLAELVRPGESLEHTLDREAPRLLLDSRSDELTPAIDELAALELAAFPRAQILAAMVAHATVPKRSDLAADLLDQADATLTERADAAGAALAAWVRGNVLLTFGDVAGAARAWARAVELDPDADLVEDLSLANLAYGSFCLDGNVTGAVELAEAAVNAATEHRHGRGRGLALVYEGYLRAHAGQFEHAERAFAEALAVFGAESPPAYEWPLAFAGQASLAAMRGQIEAADRGFLEAISLTDRMGNEWFEAIVRTLRADFTLRHDSRRAHADCRFALRVFDRLGDTWWAATARRVRADAALASGEIEAARLLTDKLLPQLTNPVERARCLLTSGRAHLRAGDDETAAAAVAEAVRLLEPTGAHFILVQALFLVAQCEPWSAPEAIERARSLSRDDAAYRQLWASRPTLRIRVLGGQSVQVGDEEVTFRTSRAEHLVMILALAGGRFVEVDDVADALWPAAWAEKLPSNLSTATYDARQALGPEAWRLHRAGTRFWLDLDGASVDLDEAMRRARGVPALDQAAPVDSDEAEQRRLAALDDLRQEILPTLVFEPWVAEANRRREALLELLSPDPADSGA